jgi:hypothetical protein
MWIRVTILGDLFINLPGHRVCAIFCLPLLSKNNGHLNGLPKRGRGMHTYINSISLDIKEPLFNRVSLLLTKCVEVL